MSPPRSKANEIKFNSRFRLATSDEILKALKPPSRNKQAKLCKHTEIFVKLLNKFAPLPKPQSSNDWLVEYHERKETFGVFLNESTISEPNILGVKTFIYYIQIGEFKQTNFDYLIEYSRIFFNEHSIKLMPKKILLNLEPCKNKKMTYTLNASYGETKIKLEARFHGDPSKYDVKQIKAQSVFKLLQFIKPKDAHCLIGFTECDLYADDTDLFVAGLCSGLSRVGVFSCFRYHPKLKYSEELWYEAKISAKSKSSDEAAVVKEKEIENLLVSRSCKLLVHETCHLIGMGHCVFMDCCMNGSGNLAEDFRQSMFLCPIDLRKLAHIIDFDPIERYKKMRDFFLKHYSKKEIDWLNDVIETFQEK